MKLTLIFIFITALYFNTHCQSNWCIQPVLEYKLNRNLTVPYSFESGGVKFDVLPGSQNSKTINLGLQVGLQFKYVSSALGLALDNNRLNNTINIKTNDLDITYKLDKTNRYYRFYYVADFVVLGRDTVKPNAKCFGQLLVSVGLDLSWPINMNGYQDETSYNAMQYKIDVKSSYGGSFAKQIMLSLGLIYKLRNAKAVNIFNIGCSYKFAQNVRGAEGLVTIKKTDNNGQFQRTYINLTSSLDGLYFFISKDFCFKRRERIHPNQK